MSVRDTIRDDPFLRKTLQTLTVIITFSMALPSFFVFYLIYSIDNLPEFAERIIDHTFPFFQTIPGDMVSIIVGAAPAVVAGVCYTSKGANKRLNSAGFICVFIAIIGFVASLVGIAFLQSESTALVKIGSNESLSNLSSSVEVSARSSLFYLAIFFGIGGGKR
jgi:hypothetical protein